MRFRVIFRSQSSEFLRRRKLQFKLCRQPKHVRSVVKVESKFPDKENEELSWPEKMAKIYVLN